MWLIFFDGVMSDPLAPTHLKLLLRVELEGPMYIVPEEMDKSPAFWVEHVTDESILTDKWRVMPTDHFSRDRRSYLNSSPLYDHLRYLRDQGHTHGLGLLKKELIG